MSKQFQFSRPVEYDPALAAAAATVTATSQAEALKDEFGFESSSDEDDEQGAEYGQQQQAGATDVPAGANGAHTARKRNARSTADDEELERAHQEELDQLAEQLAEAQEARARAEESQKRTEERLEELQAMSKQAKSILVNKFRQQLKVLMAQVDEQKAMLAEDDETLEKLRAANVKWELGDKASAEELQAKIKEFRDTRVMTRENTALRYKIAELTQQLSSLKDELAEAKDSADAAQAKVKAADGEDIVSMKARVDKLESERLIFREEIKKRHLERTKLINKLARLTNSDNPLEDLEQESSVPSAPATAGGVAPAEVAKLQLRIKQLEMSLATAQKAAAVAASSAAAVPAPAPAPVAAPAPAASSAPSARENELTASIKTLNELLSRREGEMHEVKEKAKEKLTTASNAIKKLKTEYASLRAAYTTLKEGGAASPAAKVLQSNLSRRRELLQSSQRNLAATKASLQQIKSDVQAMHADLPALGPSITGALGKYLAGRANETAHLQSALRKEMALRKQLFNQIQELKGNIRVYCRVRPMNEREKADKENLTVISFPAEGEMLVQNPEKKTSHSFEFEKIFDPSKQQADVFAEVSDLVISVLDGYSTCIFAYGQTGSGKTHTMQGPKDDPGVNIRALTKLFEVAGERFPDIKYEIKITLLEIYNEKIQDLLGEKGRVLKAVQGQYGMEVQDLTMVPVSSEHEVLDTLRRGSKNRSVVATNMNDVSSRSHLILSVYVLARNQITGKDTMGKLHLIDLAGSERVGRSGVAGEALKEAQAINSSLSALGNVIAARANKSAHVPYRDSTLTYLLQDSLEKNSKTLMFVQVSPVKSDASETICSLRFAERVRKVELGKAEAVKKK